MFQDTRGRTGSDQSQDQNKDKREQQERQNREAQRKAEEVTKETRERMANEAALRSYQLQQQAIDGRIEEMRAQERAGASAQAVVAKVEERVLPDVNHDLSKLEVPFNEDRRGEVVGNVRRTIMDRAKAIEAKTDEVTQQKEQERKAEVRREERASRGESSLV